MRTIDECGISCPEPLLMLKKALKTEKEVILFVDSKNALENCKDYAVKNGFSVNMTDHTEKYELQIKA